ncbi:MAG: immunity protein Imm33 domain-containing protein [Nocardioides sp.]
MTDRVVGYRLANSEARNEQAPRSFFIPPRSEREALRPGDYARLLFELIDPSPADPGAERMWVQVLGVADGNHVGAPTNVPRAITTVGVGDRVDFGPEHVIGTLEDWPLLEKKILVSRRSQDQDTRPSYVYREDPDNERDSSWRAMVGDGTDDEINDASNGIAAGPRVPPRSMARASTRVRDGPAKRRVDMGRHELAVHPDPARMRSALICC